MYFLHRMPTSSIKIYRRPTLTIKHFRMPTTSVQHLRMPSASTELNKFKCPESPKLSYRFLTVLKSTHAKHDSHQTPRECLRPFRVEYSSELQNFFQRVPPRNPSERLSGVRFTVLIWAGATRLKGTTHLYLNLTSPSWSNSGSSPILQPLIPVQLSEMTPLAPCLCLLCCSFSTHMFFRDTSSPPRLKALFSK